LQAGGQGFDSPQLHSGGLVEFGGFSSRNRGGFVMLVFGQAVTTGSCADVETLTVP
jgi:hypothetical protein